MVDQAKTQTDDKADEIRLFETYEQDLVAYLFCCHFHLKGSPFLVRSKVFFPFQLTPELQTEVENFRNKQYNPKVELRRYGVKIKEVQALSHYYRRLDEEEVGGLSNE